MPERRRGRRKPPELPPGPRSPLEPPFPPSSTGGGVYPAVVVAMGRYRPTYREPSRVPRAGDHIPGRIYRQGLLPVCAPLVIDKPTPPPLTRR